MKGMRLTFKNQPAATGIEAFYKFTPDIDIRINGEDIGTIWCKERSNPWDKSVGIFVGFCFIATAKELEKNPNSNWNFHYIGRRIDGKFERRNFSSTEEAKTWVRENIDRFIPHIYLKKTAVAA